MASRKARTRTANNGQGSKWISKKKRQAIYERDQYMCLWCGAVNLLTLDHLIPRCLGGSNLSSNVFTCCLSCNSRRQRQTAYDFAEQLCWDRYPRKGAEDMHKRTRWICVLMHRIHDALGAPVERRFRG